MKQPFLLAAYGTIVILGLAGCQGRAVLPPDIAGTWKAYDSPWKIVLSPYGKVSSAVIPMGEVEVKPNKTTKIEMKDGSISTFKAGDCTVEYTPETRKLYVTVRVSEIHVVFMDNQLEGNAEFYFVGEVSKDGKIWEPDFIEVLDYGPRFPLDANDIVATPLTFEKVED